MTQQFNSSREMLQQIAFARLTKDGTDEAMAKGMLGSIAEQTTTNLASSSLTMSESLATTLSKLTELGYDKDSDLVKNLIMTNTQLQAGLVKLSDAVTRLVS